MRKRIIKDIPYSDRLPPCTIFLDDLQAIEDLVRSFMDSDYALIGFVYDVDEKFLVDSIDELRSNQGHAKRLKMCIKYSRVLPNEENSSKEAALIETSELGGAYMSCPDCLGIDEQVFYHGIRKIFEPRKHHFLAAIESLPEEFRRFLISTIVSISVISLAWIAFVFGERSYTLHLSGWLNAVVLVLFVTFSLVALIPVLVAVRFLIPSTSFCRVNFHYEREKALERKKSRKDMIQKIILVIIPAVLGVIGTLLVQWLGSNPRH